ncbi:MAG: hypothetical protein ACIAXF_15355 [Phycisphaerales bacterium JB063]
MPRYTTIAQAGACLALALAATHTQAETIEGSLDKNDAVNDTFGGFADTYEIEVAEGDLLILDLASEDFDTYLILTSPDGTVYTNDDDQSVPGFHTDSRLMVFAHEAGAWQITATSFGEDDTGDYTLDHNTAEVTPMAQTEGELAEDDERSAKSGEYYDEHVVNIEAGQTLMVTLDSDDFDAYLTVYLPDGTMLTNDDTKDLNAQIVSTSSEAGEVRIIATSNRAGELGKYALNVFSAE